MEKRTLGKSGLEVTVLGYGTYWGPQTCQRQGGREGSRLRTRFGSDLRRHGVGLLVERGTYRAIHQPPWNVHDDRRNKKP